MACSQACATFVGRITVEPALFVYMLATYLQYPASQALTFSRVCLLKYNDSGLCNEIGHNDSYLAQENAVQSETSTWISYMAVALTIPSIVTTAFIGSWGDHFDRKLPLVLPCVGGALSAICFLINSIFIVSPLPLLLIGPLINGLTGGFVAMMMATFSYITHVTELRSRTSRVAILESMTYFAGAIGVLLLGVFLDGVGPVTLFSVTTALFVVALAYVLIFVHRLTPDGAALEAGSRHYLSLRHVTESVRCIFKRREGLKRSNLWILFSIIAILMINTSGLMDILLLYVKHSPLSWSYSYYGYLQGFHNGLRSIVLVTLLPLLKKFGTSDVTLTLAGLISRFAGNLLLGFSSKTWMVFMVPVLSMLEGFPSAGCRSLISSMADQNEQGKIFGSLASLESLMSLVASLVFNNLYSATQSVFPGLSFLVMAGLGVISMGLLVVAAVRLRRLQGYSPLPGTDVQ